MLYLKLSIADAYFHFIARLRNAGYNTAIVFSRHHGIAARQHRQRTQRFKTFLSSFEMFPLQNHTIERGGGRAARQLVHALGCGLDEA